MATPAPQASISLVHWCSQHSTTAVLYGSMVLCTVGIGALGLIPEPMSGWRIALHALFGLLLCGLVFARCRWCVVHSAPRTSEDIRALAQHLSRIVYLVLYAVIGVRLLLGIASSTWHGAAIDFAPFDEHPGADAMTAGAKWDFLQFLGAGLLSRGFVNVLAQRMWRALCMSNPCPLE